MINPVHNAHNLRDSYAQNLPFPHIVIDNFIEHDVALRLSTVLNECDVRSWDHDDGVVEHQVNKYFLQDPSRMPPEVANTLAFFNSQPMLDFLGELTSIEGLIADPRYWGGGIHATESGGKLDVHADFNLHPETGLHRRLNALLYLNREWRPEWNGQLELYSEDGQGEVVIDPTFNRLAVFSISDKALHGVPKTVKCPSDRKRFSLALYYYTVDRPEEEKTPFHWAEWRPAMGSSDSPGA